LWYFTEQGCQATEDKFSNRPSPNALNDEQLTWVQFMDANRLLCRWLIPAGWPDDYAEVLSSFFRHIENHEYRGIVRGKETLLLYQARTRKAWHDELKAGHFFNLAELNENKMNTCQIEVTAKYNADFHKAVSPRNLSPIASTNSHFCLFEPALLTLPFHSTLASTPCALHMLSNPHCIVFRFMPSPCARFARHAHNW
jgi:hypothetical protein